MEIDFLEIVIKAFTELECLPNYIHRSIKEAEKNNYDIDTFEIKCNNVFESLIKIIETKKHNEIKDWYSYQLQIDNNTDLTAEQKEVEYKEIAKNINFIKNEITHSHTVTLYDITKGKYTGHLTKSQIEYLKTQFEKQYNIEKNGTNENILLPLLQNTIETVCKWIEPINHSINLFPFEKLSDLFGEKQPINQTVKPLKYIEYFKKYIDFNYIENQNFDNEPNKAKTIKYINTFHYGLEQMFKTDISNAIKNYKENLPSLSLTQIRETQIKLETINGILKSYSQKEKSFTQYCTSILQKVNENMQLDFNGYQLIIAYFNDTITNYLLSEFQSINETFKEITLVKEAMLSLTNKQPQQVIEKPMPNIVIKPRFKPEIIPQLFEILIILPKNRTAI